jgi:uncharacterized coiled-coil DUF342 family protein
MSDETTQNLLANQLNEIINLVKNLTDKHLETDARVERLEQVIEQRLYDTRPIWEAVQAQVKELGVRVGALELEITGMRAEMNGMRAEMNGMRAEMVGMRAEMVGMRAEMAGMRGEMAGIRAHITEMLTQ